MPLSMIWQLAAQSLFCFSKFETGNLTKNLQEEDDYVEDL